MHLLPAHKLRHAVALAVALVGRSKALVTLVRPGCTALGALRLASKDVAPIVLALLIRALPVPWGLRVLRCATRRACIVASEDHLLVVDAIGIGTLPILWPFATRFAIRLPPPRLLLLLLRHEGRHWHHGTVHGVNLLVHGHSIAATLATTCSATTTATIATATAATTWGRAAFGATTVAGKDKLVIVHARCIGA